MNQGYIPIYQAHEVGGEDVAVLLGAEDVAGSVEEAVVQKNIYVCRKRVGHRNSLVNHQP